MYPPANSGHDPIIIIISGVSLAFFFPLFSFGGFIQSWKETSWDRGGGFNVSEFGFGAWRKKWGYGREGENGECADLWSTG